MASILRNAMLLASLIAVSASVADAQIPNVAGTYRDSERHLHTVRQNGLGVTVTVDVPGVAVARFTGRYTEIVMSDDSVEMGFKGTFRTRHADGRPDTEGMAFLIPLAEGQLRVDSFILRNGEWMDGTSHTLSLTADPVQFTPPPQPATTCQLTKQTRRRNESASNTIVTTGRVDRDSIRTDDRFGLLPIDELDDLGL